MYRFEYYGFPQAISPAPLYYRNEAVQRKESSVYPEHINYTAAVEPKFTDLNLFIFTYTSL